MVNVENALQTQIDNKELQNEDILYLYNLNMEFKKVQETLRTQIELEKIKGYYLLQSELAKSGFITENEEI